MHRIDKQKLVSRYVEIFSGNEAVFLVKNSGLTVGDSKDMRREFRKIGAVFFVGKNSLIKRSLDGAKFKDFSGYLKGPLAFVVTDDIVGSAKVLSDFVKRDKANDDKLEILCAAVSDKIFDKNEIIHLASLPGVDQLHANLVSVLSGVIKKMLLVLKAPSADLVKVLIAYANKIEKK